VNLNSPEEMETGVFHWRSWVDLTVLLIMAVDLSWVSLWVAAFSRVGAPDGGLAYGRVFAVLGGLLAGSHVLARWAQDHLHRPIPRSIFYGAAVLASLLAALEWLVYAGAPVPVGQMLAAMVRKFAAANLIPPEFWVTLLVLLIWQRGVNLVRYSPLSDVALNRFRLGMFGFLLYSLVFSAIPRHPSEILAVGVFFSAGVLSLGCEQLALVERSPEARRVRISRAWLLTLAAAALLVLLAGVGGGAVLQGKLVLFLIRALWAILSVVVLLLALLALPLILLLVFLGRRFGGAFADAFQTVADVFRVLINLLPEGSADAADRVMRTIEGGKPIYLWGLLFLFLALVVIAVNFRRWLRRLSEEAEIETGDRVHPNIRRGLSETAALLVKRLNPRWAQRKWAEARIRWVYAQLMALCTRLNIPRPAANTPLEFLPVMVHTLPESEEDLRQITRAYLQVRYGEVPETEDEVEQVLSAWQRVDTAGRHEVALRRKRLQEG
jgi:hypothetical protein